MIDIFLFLVGIVVGAMNGIAGGGMLLGFPMLIASGLSAISANATGYVASLPGQLASAFSYRKKLNGLSKRYLLLIPICILGSGIGTYLLIQTSANSFARYVPYLIISAVGLLAFQRPLQNYIKSHLRLKSKLPHVSQIIIMSLLLLPLTIYGGYFGPGFGFILLAFLSFTRLNGLHIMNGLKNIAASTMLLTSIIVLEANGSALIHWRSGLIMALGSTIGGYIGARYIQKISGRNTRITIIIIGILAAIYLAIS